MRPRTRPAAAALVACLGVAAGPLEAQRTALEQLTQTARAATVRYRDTAAAAADGYRPFGPDFPTMGRHWVNVRRVMAGGVDPTHPPILEYATIDGRTVLVGVGFAALVAGGEVPTSLPVPADAWHFHSGTLDAESFVVAHASHGAHARGRVRVAVLHLWVWESNPAGLTATDNWGLPFRRLGLRVPQTEPSADELHAVALAAGAAPYYMGYARAAGVRHPAALSEVEAALARGAARITAAIAASGAAELSPALAAVAARGWAQVWDEVEARTSPAVRRTAEPGGPTPPARPRTAPSR